MLSLALGLILTTVVKGDTNCDGVIDFKDIDSFVTAINDGAAAWAQSTGCPVESFLCLNDINGDGAVDFADINPFVELLTNATLRAGEPGGQLGAVERPGPGAPAPTGPGNHH